MIKVLIERTQTHNRVINNQVGTDKDFTDLFPGETPLRTVPPHSDGNSIYVAKNGNDANPGTSASPVLTMAEAFIKANSGTKANIVVIRNGFIGDIVFEDIVRDSSNYPEDIFVEANEYAEWNHPNTYQQSHISTITIGYKCPNKIVEFLNYHYMLCGNGMVGIYGAPNQEVKRSNNLINWATVTITTADSVSDIYVWGNYIYYLDGGTCTYSIDGINWNFFPVSDWGNFLMTFNGYLYMSTSKGIRRTNASPATSGWTDIYTDGAVYSLEVFNGKLYGCTDNGIIVSNDGINWELFDESIKVSMIKNKNNILFAYDRYVGGHIYGNIEGLYYINIEDSKFKKIFEAININDINYYKDYYYILDWTNRKLIRFKEFSLSESNDITGNISIYNNDTYYYFNGYLLIWQDELYSFFTYDSSNIRGYVFDDYIYNNMTNHAKNIMGFSMNGKDMTNLIIRSFSTGDTTGIKYCNVSNAKYTLLIGSYLGCYNSYLKNCLNGIICDNLNCVVYNNIIYNIANKSIILNDNIVTPMVNVKNNTFFNTKISIYCLMVSISVNNIINNIFYFIHNYNVYSDPDTLTNRYAVYSQDKHHNCNIDANSHHANPLFYNPLNNDFRIWKKGAGYPVNSKARKAGDDGKDIGAIDTTYTLNTDSWQTVNIKTMPAEIDLSIPASKLSTFESSYGNIYQDDYGKRIIITLKYNSDTHLKNSDIHLIERILSDSGYQRWYLADYTTGVNGFYHGNWQFVAANNKLVVTAATFEINQWAGFWVTIYDSGFKSFLIESNTADELFLVNPDDEAYPSNGNYDCVIDFIEFKVDKRENINVNALFKSFSKGQRWYYDDDNINYGFTGITIKLVQHIRKE